MRECEWLLSIWSWKKDRQASPDSLYEHGVRWNEWALLKNIALFRFKTQKYTWGLNDSDIVRDMNKARLRSGNALNWLWWL